MKKSHTFLMEWVESTIINNTFHDLIDLVYERNDSLCFSVFLLEFNGSVLTILLQYRPLFSVTLHIVLLNKRVKQNSGFLNLPCQLCHWQPAAPSLLPPAPCWVLPQTQMLPLASGDLCSSSTGETYDTTSKAASATVYVIYISCYQLLCK